MRYWPWPLVACSGRHINAVKTPCAMKHFPAR
nr:MAG TPA: hypothetical protein [Bacteriophage sp.]